MSPSDLGFLSSTPLRRLLMSLALTWMMTGVLVWNLPSSELRRRAIPVFRPLVHALALDQDWGLFSPEPRQLSFQFEARARFRDGSLEVFSPPLGDPYIGLYRGYRWKKWSERIRRNSKKALWEGTARHFAGRYDGDPRGLVSIELVRRWSQSPPLGSGRERTWKEHRFHEVVIEVAGDE